MLFRSPTTLLTNWQRELCRFAPGLSTLVYHGPKRIIPKEGPDVVITSYGVVRTDLAQLQVVDWRALIIDEAQQIKNHDTDQTRAVKRLQAPVRIAMSGTPVENRLSEYWSISDFSNKGLLGNSSYFQDHFAKPIQKDQDQHKLEQFRQVVRPFILRRLKTDTSIIQDLPEKVEQNCFAQLTQEQAVMYAGLVEQSLKAIQSTGEGGIARRGLVLKMMTALKQICNHPVQFLKQGQPNPEQSGKLQLLLELVENILESGEKVLIFSQYQEMGALLGGAIEKRFGFEPLFLHGGCSRNERDRMVEVFQNHAHPSVFILSLKAGGTGLNLTAANHVIHYDLWWNPAVEAQATDRAFRIGQQRNVMVYRFVTQGTLEEKIDALLHDKKQLANLTVESGENWIGHLSNNELESLVKLD